MQFNINQRLVLVQSRRIPVAQFRTVLSKSHVAHRGLARLQKTLKFTYSP
jgi:hypothetical protein